MQGLKYSEEDMWVPKSNRKLWENIKW